ncbi:MAG: ChaN family lipoprotein [Phycisphaerae bacterium]|nr:ChaN family lipoprotein [Phycisphaerae bacterium]
MRRVLGSLFKVCLPLLFLFGASCSGANGGRCSFWIDVYEGEPVLYEDVVDDLAGVRVIYLGERHTLKRHHAIQQRIVADLVERHVPLVLALEQMEFFQQPALDEYCKGGIDFDQLAERTEWSKRWPNFEQYRQILEAARRAGAPILAINARGETVRQVARNGIDGLDPEASKELPAEMDLDDPMYERKLNRVMMVHAKVTEALLRKMFEAQVSRDETMAERLCAFLESEQGRGRTAVVLCGAGHISHGLGLPSRVRRRLPDVTDRIVVLTDSGDVELPPKMKAMARDITITHEQLHDLDKPIADYLHATNLKR